MDTSVVAVADESSSMEGVVINPMPVGLHGTPIKAFTCKYCSRRFIDSPGLGGHQNAQKREKNTILATGIIPNNSCKKTKPVEEMEISSYALDPRKPSAGALESKKSYLQHPSIYYSDLPSVEVITKAKANYTGMWQPDASSSSSSPQQSSYQYSFVPNLDLDLHL